MKHENKDYIEGIFNYCDRWCEKCKLTSNCKLFSIESRIHTHQILNDGEMPDAEIIFNEAIGEELDDEIEEDDELEYGDDFDEEKENEFFIEKEKQKYPVEELADEYMQKTRLFIKKLDENFKITEVKDTNINEENYNIIFENFEIIAWYHMFIFVKIKRALNGKSDLKIGMDEMENEFEIYDMNGSAKIAAIAVKKSQDAFNNFLLILDEYSAEIGELMVLLGRILNALDYEFPDYKNFKRPGFDKE